MFLGKETVARAVLLGNGAVLNAQQHVRVGAAALRLLQEAAISEGGGHPREGRIGLSPRLTVAVCHTLAPCARAMPHHLVRPSNTEHHRKCKHYIITIVIQLVKVNTKLIFQILLQWKCKVSDVRYSLTKIRG